MVVRGTVLPVSHFHEHDDVERVDVIHGHNLEHGGQDCPFRCYSASKRKSAGLGLGVADQHQKFLIARSTIDVTEEEVKKSYQLRLDRVTATEIISHGWGYILSAALVTVTTALIYPASTSLVKPAQPANSEWHQTYFNQVTFQRYLKSFLYPQ